MPGIPSDHAPHQPSEQDSDQAAKPLLQHADIKVDIQAPLACTRLRQHFVNSGDTVIEAIYDFQLPRSAAVLAVSVSINEQSYHGEIAAQPKATQRYEQGVNEGKRAVHISDLGDGQYQLRAGNLLPNDRLTIELTLAHSLDFTAEGYRYFLPTVIAPKYGDTSWDKTLAQETSLLATYPFRALVQLYGEADGVLQGISHPLTPDIERGYRFEGMLDQDIVLALTQTDPRPYLLHDQQSALTVIPPVASTIAPPPASLIILLDCSGSMEGAAIRQACEGLSHLLRQLPRHSEISLICFGSKAEVYTQRPVKLDADTQSLLISLLQRIDADLGGTELWAALDAANAQAVHHETVPDLVVITDGQVWDAEPNLSRFQAEQNHWQRMHALGVGSAVSEDLILQLAETVRGHWCLLHPSEPMSQRVHYFMAGVCGEQKTCDWQSDATQWHALPDQLNPTIGGLGYLSLAEPQQAAQVRLNDHPLPSHRLAAPLQATLHAVVAKQQLYYLPPAQAESHAIQHGLLSAYTAFVMVGEEVLPQADGLPDLAVVPQMQAASSMIDRGMVDRGMVDRGMVNRGMVELADAGDYLTIPRFLRRADLDECFDECAVDVTDCADGPGAPGAIEIPDAVEMAQPPTGPSSHQTDPFDWDWEPENTDDDDWDLSEWDLTDTEHNEASAETKVREHGKPEEGEAHENDPFEAANTSTDPVIFLLTQVKCALNRARQQDPWQPLTLPDLAQLRDWQLAAAWITAVTAFEQENTAVSSPALIAGLLLYLDREANVLGYPITQHLKTRYDELDKFAQHCWEHRLSTLTPDRW